MAERHAGAIYGHSKGSRPGSKHFYRSVWSGGRWDEFVETRHLGTLLQVCCGASTLGDVRVDITKTAPTANVIASMYALPFRTNAFDTVACDPPYGIAMPQRVHLQRELVRVARARVLFKGTWIPRATDWKLGETVLVATETCQNIGVLSVLDYVHREQFVLFRIDSGDGNR